MEPPSPVRFSEFDLCLIYDSLGQTSGDKSLVPLVEEALKQVTNFQHAPQPVLTLNVTTPQRAELVRSLDKLINNEDYFTDVPQYKSCIALRERLAGN